MKIRRKPLADLILVFCLAASFNLTLDWYLYQGRCASPGSAPHLPNSRKLSVTRDDGAPVSKFRQAELALAAILAVGGVSTAIWLRRSRRRRKRSATEAVATER